MEAIKGFSKVINLEEKYSCRQSQNLGIKALLSSLYDDSCLKLALLFIYLFF